MIEILADSSDILFFCFALLVILSVSLYIAHNLVKRNVLKSLENEYELLKHELKIHIEKNTYSICFSDEALELHSKAKEVLSKITELKGVLK